MIKTLLNVNEYIKIFLNIAKKLITRVNCLCNFFCNVHNVRNLHTPRLEVTKKQIYCLYILNSLKVELTSHEILAI